MTNINPKKTDLQKSLRLNNFSFRANRIVFQAGGPSENAGGKEVVPPKPSIDIKSPDFDNVAFKDEKRGKFNSDVNSAIRDAITQVPELKDHTDQIDQLKTDFTTGLNENILNFKEDIASAIKDQSPALYKDKDSLTRDNANDWFQKVLINLKCNSVGLVYDKTDDTTKFKFYGEKGEIKFKSSDIKVQYVPRNLSDSAATSVEAVEQQKEFAVGSKEKLAKNYSVDHVELMKAHIGRAPVEGERVIIKRGNAELKGHFDDKKKLFIGEDGAQLWFIGPYGKSADNPAYGGDKVTFYPNTKEKPGAANQVEVDGTQYLILRQIDTKASYLDVAKAILQYSSGKGAVIDNVQVLDDETCASIVKSNISVPEYAALLKSAHEKLGKNNRLPIVMPAANLERKYAIRAKSETAKADVINEQAKKKTAEALNAQLKAGLDVAKSFLKPEQLKEVAGYMAEYEGKLAKEKDPAERLSIIQDLLDKLDNYFSEDGFSRPISKNLENVMDAGRDGDAWKELWTKENPTVNKVMSVIDANPDVFGKQNKNAVRGTVFDLIRNGNSSAFDSGDIIKFFKLKLPVQSKEYDEVLGLAAAPTATAPDLKAQQDKCIRFVSAIESLSMAISGLDPNQNKEAIASAKGHEKLSEKAEGGAKNLKKLIDLLNVNSSTPINKEGEDTWASTVEKGGKKITLRLQEQGSGQFIGAYDTENGTQLWREWDNFGFDAPDYVDKINSVISTAAKSKSAEKADEKLPETALNGKPDYISLRSLETLNQSVPGVPAKELFNVRGSKEVRLFKDLEGIGETNLAKKTRSILESLSVYDSAKFVDTPDNLNNLRNNDQVLINLRYRGKDFTLHINNATVGWGVRMKPGFNNENAKDGDTAYTTAGGMDVAEAVQGIDNVLKGYGSNVEYMSTGTTNERLAIMSSSTAEFNKLISEHTKAIKFPQDLTLTDKQMMEAIFRTYSFDELKQLNCIKKVSGSPKAYVVTDLPPKFKNVKSDQQILNLAQAIKYGTNATKAFADVMTKSGETAREGANEQVKYENRLKKLFATGLTDFDSKGKKVTMSDVDSGSTTNYSKDEYFKKVSGDAAYADFYDRVRTRDDKGVEKIDVSKANDRLTDLYQKGLTRLSMLSKTDKDYADLNKSVTDALRTKKIDLNTALTDLDQKIIRLGYLSDVESREKDQGKGLEQFKNKLVENILKLLPDKIEDPKNPGHFINKEQAAATLDTLPVGILLSYSHNSDGSNTVGGYLPITLDVFGSDYAKLVILPGVDNTDGLRLAVGVAFTNKDPNDKNQNVIFMGGISVGLGTTFTEASFGAAIGGGVDFRIVKADEIDNYNHYLGIRAGFGLDVTRNQYGFEVGPVYTWEIDAQQKYTNSLREYFQKEGIQGYINELKEIYAKGSQPAAVEAFVAKLKKDPSMVQKLDLKADTTSDVALANFELYVAGLMNNFNENFNLPTIVGGQVGIGVVDGAIMATGAATGNVPLLLGGVAAWGIQLLASLKFNVGSKMVIERKQKTSESEMGAFAEQDKQNQFDAAFADPSAFPRSKEAAKFFTSGRNTLDVKGKKQTSMGVEVNSSSAEVPADNLGKKLDDFNKSLTAKGIDMQLKKGADNRIELVLLDSKVAANERILISPDLAVTEGNKIFLKDPNNLTFLYFNKQTRKYPLETSHGATMETVVTIADNRFLKGDTFPTEISITRFADNKENPVIAGKAGKAEAFVDSGIDYSGVAESQGKMKKALDKSGGIEAEPVRPNLKEIAKKLFDFTRKGETFISITSEKAKAGLDNPNYLSEKLYGFYDDFAKANKLTDFNASEKALLTLELSTLRYTKLMAGAPNAYERAARFRERLNWAKETIRPYFEKRLTELNAAGKLTLKPGETVQQRAKVLVDKAIGDLQYLDTSMPATKLKEGTSVAVAIGVGGRGLHQMLDGTRDKLQTKDVDDYGYIMGKDYTDAIRTGAPADDHDIGLILMGQLSALPEAATDLKGFMDSNIARKLASNGGLAFILGKDNYSKVVEFYNSGAGDAAALAPFIDIVKKVRAAEQSGQELISVKGDKNITFLIKVNPQIQSGVFQKCGNYSAAITEDIAILPPSQEEAMVLLASKSEAITSLTTQAYKQFVGLFGGVTASVSLTYPGGSTGGGGNKESAGQTGKTKTGSGDRNSDQQTTPGRTPPYTVVPGAPTDPTKVDQGGGTGA